MIPDLQLWQLDCRTLPDDVLGWCDAVLSSEETQKAARYKQPLDQLRFRIGRGMSRILTAEMCGCSATDLIWAQADKGKPYWVNADCPFNVSHSGDWVYLAIGGDVPVGVDIQRQDPSADIEGIANFVLSAAEIAELSKCDAAQYRMLFFKLWVVREAALKATGQGIFDLTAKVCAFPLPREDEWARMPDLGDDHLSVRYVNAPAGYAAALALITRSEHPVRPQVMTWADFSVLSL